MTFSHFFVPPEPANGVRGRKRTFYGRKLIIREMISNARERVHPETFHDRGARDRVLRAHRRGNDFRILFRVRACVRGHVRVRVRARESARHHHAGVDESGYEHACVYGREYALVFLPCRSPRQKWFNSNNDRSFIQVGLSAHVVKSGHTYFIKTLTFSSCLPLICLTSSEAADRFVLLTRRYLPFRINYAKMEGARQP